MRRSTPRFSVRTLGRTCYARAHRTGWVLVVRQIVAQRESPVMLRVWGRLERVPDDDANCLAMWERCAYALTPHWQGCAAFHIALPRTAVRRDAAHRHAAHAPRFTSDGE